MKKKVLFAISSLGLGHATRTLTVINSYKKDYDVTIVSFENTLEYLKKELGEEITFLSLKDYPEIERGKGLKFYFYLIFDLLATSLIIGKEKRKVREIGCDYDFIFSDGRYGFCSNNVPSFILSHQITFIAPKFLNKLMFITDLSNFLYFKNFDKLFIPDFSDYENSLAGKLSHPQFIKYLDHEYIGILSSYDKKEIKKDVDYLFIISGYLKESKDNFVSKLIEEAKTIKGKKIFVLGDSSSSEIVELEKYDITIYPTIHNKFRKELFNRAKIIISRAGYTTILDLVETEKKAILFATPNQSEQEYLAKFHSFKNNFVIAKNQDNFNLKELIKEADQTITIKTEENTERGIEKIKKIIDQYTKENFISIVIPAHNEEKYLSVTLDKISQLDYKNFEVIVVENGSVDNTFEVALRYKDSIKNLKVLKSEKGVSRAKNFGLKNSSEISEWTLFLDADTIIEKFFLKKLNKYINKQKKNSISVGTCSIFPLDSKLKYDKLWFKFYNLGHKMTRTSYSVQFAKTSIAKVVKFDEELEFSEDLDFIRNMEIFGKFYFFNTREVFTSTRRFKQNGYIRTFIKWNIQALTPRSLKIKSEYKVVR